jgi:alkylhydroperoxidase family enzyme
MSEHLLFLQAAGSDFDRSHNLVAAVVEAIRAPYGEQTPADNRDQYACLVNGFPPGCLGVDPERIAQRVERAGWQGPESLLVALAAHATIASPLTDVDFTWMASATARVGDADLLLETAGVVFAFNTINRIANALQVQLEYRFLRGLKPIRGWLERRLASLTGLVYDLSYKHQPRHSPEERLDRLNILFERLGAPVVPDVFKWLSQSPVVLEGVLEMLEANVTTAGVRLDLLKEAAAIAVASRAMPGSGLSKAVHQWLPQGSLTDSNAFRTWAGASGVAAESSLESECRRYSWQVANAAHTISDEQIRKLSALGLADAELLDLTIAASVFSALAIIEPISAAVATNSGRPGPEVAATADGHVQSASVEELAV